MRPPLALYYSSEMDTKEACPGFIVLEEEIAEDDEEIVIDWF